MTTLRPALAALASTPGATTVRKLWKALTAEERTQAVTAALADDPEGWVKATSRAAVASALRFRPQTVATWPRGKLIAEAVRLPLDDSQLLSAFIVDLHLAHRRPMMAAFLDALGIANDAGRIDSETVEVAPQEREALDEAAGRLLAEWPVDEVVTYFLTLLLQDAVVWAPLLEWLPAHKG